VLLTKNLDDRPNFWSALRDERGEDIDKFFSCVDGFRGDGVEGLVGFVEQDGAGEAGSEARGEVFLGVGQCA